MKRLGAALLAATMCLGLLAGCSSGNDGGNAGGSGTAEIIEVVDPSEKLDSPPDEKQLAYDLSQYGVEMLETNQLAVKSCELVKRQSNPEVKTDETHVKAICEGPYSKMELYFQMDYKFYDVGGWILENVHGENHENAVITYYDANRTDILESMVWITGLYPDQIRDAEVYSLNTAYTDLEYCILVNGTPYSIDGERLAKGISNNNNSGFVDDVFVNEAGELRLIVEDAPTEHGRMCYLADGNGTQLSAYYDGMYRSGDHICVAMWGKERDSWGVISLEGIELVALVYETETEAEDVLNGGSSTTKSGNNSVERTYTYVYYDQYQQFYDENQQPLLNFEYAGAEYDWKTKMILVDFWGNYQFYDHRGLPRTPEFVQVINGGEKNIVQYGDRYGLLPQILTAEERQSVRYERTDGASESAAD